MDFYDSIKTGELIRERLMKDGKFLIARIGGSRQEGGKKKVLDDYFRYKDYIDNEEWYKATLKEIWSSKFIGLRKDYLTRPIIEAKILEYQNPSYSAALRMGGDPRDYNKVFTVQLAGCDYDCNYCYVPKELNVANPRAGNYFSAGEIIDRFLFAKNNSLEPMNVVRISGGNPGLAPEIIIDILDELKKRKLNIYIWIDSNLSTPVYMKNLGESFKNILRQKNVGVVGCFKGVAEEDFSLITGVKGDNYIMQFDTAKWFIEAGADFYVYVPALVYGNDTEKKIRAFIEKLRVIDKNLPLRVEILEIIDYPWAKLNFERSEKIGRGLPKEDQRIFLDMWYNKLLPEFYSQEELSKYCCQISLGV